MSRRRQAPGIGRKRAVGGSLLIPALVTAWPALAQVATPPAVITPVETPGLVTLLLRQARYWRNQGQYDKAQIAVDRAVQVAPNDRDVLQAEGDLQASSGNLEAARRTQAILSRVAPGSRQLEALDRALQVRAIDPATLSGIRASGVAGDNQAAVSGYRAIFGNNPPPPELALEYYQSLAGTQKGWPEARSGLAAIVARDPEDLQAQLAYAQVLTFREPTRAQGIGRLQGLAALAGRSPAVASSAAQDLRQALLWLPSSKDSIPAFQKWLQAHPDDTVIAERSRNTTVQAPADLVGTDRSNGFNALASGRLDDAAAQFTAALIRAPNDPDALGGLGLVRARQNRTAEAAQSLRQAIAADRAHASRWQPALDGLATSEDYAAAHELIAHGRNDEAQQKLESLIRHGGDTTGAQLMLADLQQKRGRNDAAGNSFRTILAAHPDNPDALLGLARLEMHAGQAAKARSLLDRLGGRRARDVAQIEAQQTDNPAGQSGSLDERIAALQDAVGRNGGDPWLRLRLAQALLKADRHREAQSVMAVIGQMANPPATALQAGILFAGQANDLGTARALLARLPVRSRTPDTQAVADQVALDAEINGAEADGSAGHGRLVALAQRPDPTGARGIQIAQALVRLGDKAAAGRALQLGIQAVPSPMPAQRLAYAGSMLGMGNTKGARTMLAALDSQLAVRGSVLTPDQDAARKRLVAGLAVVDSDRLNEQGQQADAYDRLAPVLAADPDAVASNLALARLYQSDQRPRKALALDLAVLERSPSDLDAHLAAVQAAVDCGDLTQAAALARDALVIDPEDPRAWLAAAAVHRARNNGRAALGDLAHAREVRRQQLGLDRNTAINDAVASDTSVDGNPFRRRAASNSVDLVTESDGTDPDGLGGNAAEVSVATSPKAAPDAMLGTIESQIDTLQTQMSPSMDVDIGLRSRSGSGGLDSLTQATVPIVATLPVGVGSAHWFAGLTPTVLSSGSMDQAATTLSRFGTLALHPSDLDTSGSSNQAGVAFEAGYANSWLSADAASSPLGFRIANVLGSLELSPKLTPNLTLRLTGERRAVTDSVLSYAGLHDPGSNSVWGGVTRSRGHAQIELANREAVFYAGGGYSMLNGTHVASNSEIEAGIGGSIQVWHQDDQRVRIGIDVTYFGYDKNLRYFTLGQGGYFSPQSYIAAVVPVTWSGKSGSWSWTAAGSVGYQNYTEHSSAYYPDDPGLQTALENSSATLTSYAGRSVSGLAGSANGKVEYQLTSSLRLGATASYQRAGDWDEAQALLTARYSFSGNP